MRPPRLRIALAAVFGLLSLNALVQVVLAWFGRSDDPAFLTALQALVGLVGAAAAWGSWKGARWAPAAAVLHGVVTAGMLVALESLIDIGAEARGGLWTGAAIILLFSIIAGWYLRRDLGRKA